MPVCLRKIWVEQGSSRSDLGVGPNFSEFFQLVPGTTLGGWWVLSKFS